MKIRVLKAQGALRDCTVGKSYKAKYVHAGDDVMLLQGGVEWRSVKAGEPGWSFLDDSGDTVGLQLAANCDLYAAGVWDYDPVE
ncbi:hypothetical protein [Pantoea phage LIMEzero]|uniref:Uncharacterized protein n=1 Tax=Pantoea phage LIMEzero TaxID=943335 RepID=F4N9Q8_9CAUD|nr:hypothetical protein LIMEzero_ORF05 [Pantoea phage LIMEzero]CBY88536.1 hypothetical protein [Pantoea phage LIMEzero]